MAYMPADRSHRALVRDMTVAENLMLRDSRHEPYARGCLLDGAGRTKSARRLMADYDIRAAGPGAITARLSGGNQQKVVIARELDRSPAVLVAHQAAWGLDPGATRFVLDRVIGLRDAGAAVLYVSSELEEVLAISDRIAVMSGGSFVAIVRRAEADLRQIGLWMAGRAA
jgi:simple sugar transport system ATP-binding protein